MIRKNLLPINNFAPEINLLKKAAKEAIEEGKSHTQDVIKNSKNPVDVLTAGIVDIVTLSPEKVITKTEKVSKPIASIAEKVVEEMTTSKNNIVQNIGETIQNNPAINPSNIIKKGQNIFNEQITALSEKKDKAVYDIGKNVVKNKIKNSFFKTIADFFKKIKNYIIPSKKQINNP